MGEVKLSSAVLQRIREQHPHSVPVFVLRGSDVAKDIPPLDKCKFIIPRDLSVGQFVYIIRRRMCLPPEKTLFVFVKDVLPASSCMMGQLYSQYMDDDGALRVTYSSESVFGDTI